MDIKKIDKIKAPEDWVEEALNPEKYNGSVVKTKI